MSETLDEGPNGTGSLGRLIPWPDEDTYPNIPADEALELFLGWVESRGIELWPHQEEALMSIMVGWEIKPKSLYGEIDSGYNGHIHGFYTFCIKYLCPVIMFFILLVQISTFFGLGWFN